VYPSTGGATVRLVVEGADGFFADLAPPAVAGDRAADGTFAYETVDSIEPVPYRATALLRLRGGESGEDVTATLGSPARPTHRALEVYRMESIQDGMAPDARAGRPASVSGGVAVDASAAALATRVTHSPVTACVRSRPMTSFGG
jgi:hypothetical protein